MYEEGMTEHRALEWCLVNDVRIEFRYSERKVFIRWKDANGRYRRIARKHNDLAMGFIEAVLEARKERGK